MQLDWEGLFKRYVFDATKTPYFTAVSKLDRRQAGYEIFFYCLFLTVLFGVLAVASVSPSLPHKGSVGVTFIAFGLCASAIIFGYTKHPAAAVTTAIAPVACLAYFLLYGFHPRIGDGDKILIPIVLFLWLRYSWRILGIARTYPDMPEAPPPTPPQP